jgi:hypothetical protein
MLIGATKTKKRLLPFSWNCRGKKLQHMVQQKPKQEWKQWVWSSPYECHSQSIRPSPSSQRAVTSCHYSQWLHQLSMLCVGNLLKTSGRKFYTKSASWISVSYQEATGRLNCEVSLHSGHIANKIPIAPSLKLQ